MVTSSARSISVQITDKLFEEVGQGDGVVYPRLKVCQFGSIRQYAQEEVHLGYTLCYLSLWLSPWQFKGVPPAGGLVEGALIEVDDDFPLLKHTD